MQCAALAKANLVYATGTEDADALTFGTPILVRHLSLAEARKMPIVEVNLEAALEGLKLTHEQVRHCIRRFCSKLTTIISIDFHLYICRSLSIYAYSAGAITSTPFEALDLLKH